MALGEYLRPYFDLHPLLIGVLAIILFTAVHLFSVLGGGEVHFAITLFKLLLISVFIIQGFRYSKVHEISLNPIIDIYPAVIDPGFSVALLFAVFSYTGWNATCYVIDEMKSPRTNILWSLVIGATLVSLIYVFLNYTFLINAEVEEISGMIDIGNYIGIKIFGTHGAIFFTAMISLALVSSISGLIVGGSRVIKVMGEDYPRVRRLSTVNSKEVPYRALLFQSLLAIGILLTFTFESILAYTGFTLIVFSFITVLGNFRVKRKSKVHFIYFVAIWIYLGINSFLIVYVIYAKWLTAVISLGTIVLVYILAKSIMKP